MATLGRPWAAGPTVKTVQDVYGFEPAYRRFLDKVQEIHLMVRGGPPFDPNQFAELLGVRVIESDIAVDGMLERATDERFTIYIKKSANYHRKRFTLCHELAHTFFYDILARSKRFQGKSTYDSEEERLCDRAAAALLMPISFFSKDLKAAQNLRGITPTTLLGLVDRYRVSLQAVAIRIVGITPGVICALWKREGNDISTKWVAPQSLKPLLLCRTGKSSIETALECSGESVGRDSFYCPGKQPRRITRKTASLAFRSGQVVSVSTSSHH
jgi:Zn-dependent peptidase ImmA (M78 family)